MGLDQQTNESWELYKDPVGRMNAVEAFKYAI